MDFTSGVNYPAVNYMVQGYSPQPQMPLQNLQNVNYGSPQPQHQQLPMQNVKLSYKCNFLEQLQGMYECDNGSGEPDRINVLMPTWKNQVTSGSDQGCTIVRCVSADGEALPDQMILEEANRFILASIDQEVEAYMMKGVDMKNGLRWVTLAGKTMFWSRVGHVTFNFVSPDTLNRSQVGSFPRLERTFSNTSMSSVTSTFSQSSPEYVPVQPQQPYPQQSILPTLRLAHSLSQHSEASSTDSFPSYDHNREPSAIEDQQEVLLLEQIKRLCHNRPRLVKRVVHWGLSRDTEPVAIKMNPDLCQKLAKGRIWVCVDKLLPQSKALTGSPTENTPELDSLDDLKGAYQEGSDEGIYIQPRPEANQPGTQHRLRKENGYWVIEEFDPEQERNQWVKRTVEQPGGRWWDVVTQRKIRLKLVSLDQILQRLGGDYSELFSGNIEKQMDFLFLSCNQKKLNTKLKKRNLKHNIANLKVKLEKQHCLSFAVRIANIADSIAKEYGVHPN